MSKLPYTIRVQIPVYTNSWMKGDRYGEVTKITREHGKGSRAGVIAKKLPNGSHERDIAWVKLDKSKRVIKVIYADCEVIL